MSHHLIIQFTFLFLLPTVCHGFAAPKPDAVDNLLSTVRSSKNLVSSLQSKFNNRNNQKKKSQAEGPQSILDELDLNSSTEPKTFGFQAKQIPDLLTAAFPVSLYQFNYLYCIVVLHIVYFVA